MTSINPYQTPQPFDSQPPQQQMPAEGRGLLMSLVGAMLGAGVGAGIWTAISVVSGYQIGYIAILAGAMAGWGAVLVGKQKSHVVGVIAAVAGAAAILCGSYLSFHYEVRSDATRAEVRKSLEQNDSDFAVIPEEERQAAFDVWYEQEVLPNVSYVEAMSDSPKDVAFLALFGAFGLIYGYRVGAGVKKRG
jgi:hypothetical protein